MGLWEAHLRTSPALLCAERLENVYCVVLDVSKASPHAWWFRVPAEVLCWAAE